MRIRIYTVGEDGGETLIGVADDTLLRQMGAEFEAALAVLLNEEEVLIFVDGRSMLLRRVLP